jgi:tripartite-type tricarboxylate transporter receptor subunit TctC
MTRKTLIASLAAASTFAILAAPASAQSVENFYKGKNANMYIGFSAGGSYDFYGRLVARHLGKHIPGGPSIVAQAMPGAGSFKAANYIYAVAPKDGTALGIVSQNVALEEALGNKAVRYKANDFNWIGRTTSIVEVHLTWNTSKAKTIQDVFTNETPVASTGPGSPSEGYPRLLNGMLGAKFKIIGGYTGSTAGMLAMERGEVDGALTSWNTLKVSKQDWLKGNKINLLVQYTLERSPELPNVPAVVELGKTQADKDLLAFYSGGGAVGRSFMTTPGVPAERVTALRRAFDAMTKDPAFLGEIEKTKSEFNPMSGEKLQELIANMVKVSPDVIKRMQGDLGAPKKAKQG